MRIKYEYEEFKEEYEKEYEQEEEEEEECTSKMRKRQIRKKLPCQAGIDLPVVHYDNDTIKSVFEWLVNLGLDFKLI